MVRTSQSVRVLGPADVTAALAVVARDPVANVFADYRTRITQLDPRWLGGEMWGYHEGDELVSLCHVGANLVPVAAGPAACEAFAERGPRLDARAYLVIRGWVRDVVRVPIEDPQDPTPYWLLSSRRPNDIVAAIRGSRRRSGRPSERGEA